MAPARACATAWSISSGWPITRARTSRSTAACRSSRCRPRRGRTRPWRRSIDRSSRCWTSSRRVPCRCVRAPADAQPQLASRSRACGRLGRRRAAYWYGLAELHPAADSLAERHRRAMEVTADLIRRAVHVHLDRPKCVQLTTVGELDPRARDALAAAQRDGASAVGGDRRGRRRCGARVGLMAFESWVTRGPQSSLSRNADSDE